MIALRYPQAGRAAVDAHVVVKEGLAQPSPPIR